ncbi:MAG TPA: ISNCY family transposase [Paludibacter sp.]|nr:ISNCY family transposase [Paludibacter sp.]
MELHNELKLRFDDPIWAYSPELALFDIFIEKHPEMVKEVGKDVLKLVKNNGKGRQDSPSVETVLRAAIYMSIEKLTYRNLEKDMYDSKVCFHFLRLEEDHYYSFSVMQKFISAIKEDTILHIIKAVNKLAISEGIEDGKALSSDTTNIQTDVHYPTNNALIYDCIKTAHRLLKKIKKDKSDQDRLDKMQKNAKELNYKINNTKKDNQQQLFFDYMTILSMLITESKETVKRCPSTKHVVKLSNFLASFDKVFNMSFKHQILCEQVPNADKLFSIFEPHTSILVKGHRKIEFGHKMLITRGKSNLILDHKVFEDVPADSNLLLPSIDRIIENYNVQPADSSNDGGFVSKANIEGCKEKGLINIVFTKITRSLKNIAQSPEIERQLKIWRGTTEAVISNLKRGFDIQRVLWHGFEKFCAKIAWSVLGYNLRVITNRILE